jgi:DNA-binding ferritin-like protein
MDGIGLLLGTLMQSRNQAHIYHLQVQGMGSYAAHKALNNYYEEIVDLVDSIAESYQGRYGIITGYKMADTIREDNNARMYFDGLGKFVETVRKQLPQDSYLQNQVDEVVALIEGTKYKLKFLQ